jgi:hypothetical protein
MRLIVVACAVEVAGIKSSSLAIGLACRVVCRHSCQPNGLGWVQRPLAVGVGLHGLSPTPGIPVGWLICFGCIPRSVALFCRSVLSVPCRLLRFAYWETPTCGYLACCYFFYHGRFSRCSPAYCDLVLVQFKKSTPVVPVSTGLLVVLRSFSRSVGALPLTSLLDLLVVFVLPVVPGFQFSCSVVVDRSVVQSFSRRIAAY